jgi:hypothetical protein
MRTSNFQGAAVKMSEDENIIRLASPSTPQAREALSLKEFFYTRINY